MTAVNSLILIKGSTEIMGCPGIGLVAVVLGASTGWAAGPVSEVILETYSFPDWSTGGDVWQGTGVMWLDGVRYTGTYTHTGEGQSNQTGWHGTEVKVYHFSPLGWMELSGTGKTKFAYVSPEHRWHRYSSNARVTDGTGIFSDAHGTLQFVGYTNWDLTAAPPDAYAFEGARSVITGIQLPQRLASKVDLPHSRVSRPVFSLPRPPQMVRQLLYERRIGVAGGRPGCWKGAKRWA